MLLLGIVYTLLVGCLGSLRARACSQAHFERCGEIAEARPHIGLIRQINQPERRFRRKTRSSGRIEYPSAMLDTLHKKRTHNGLRTSAIAGADRFEFLKRPPLPAICAVLSAPDRALRWGVSHAYPEPPGWVVLGLVVAGRVADPSRNAGCVVGVRGRV